MSKSKKSLLAEFVRYFYADKSTTQAQDEHLFGLGAVAELEAKLAEYYQKKHVLLVSNATTGLFALAIALGLKDNEFITSPLGYGASFASWMILGNRPVFADIDPSTVTLDPQKMEKSITSNTKAILAVDIFGNPSDSLGLKKISDKHGLWYVADSAQSFGANRNGSPASHLADALVISFTSGKTLFAGEGGAIVTDNSNLYEKLLWFTQHPYRQKRELALGISNEFGFNARIHPIAATWANSDFEVALEELKAHQRICFDLIERLNGSNLIKPIDFENEGIFSSFFRLTVELNNNVHEHEIERFFSKEDIRIKTAPIPASIIYKNQAFLAQYQGDFSVPKRCWIAEHQAKRRIALAF